MIVLITGPVRAGKSTRAAQVARAFGFPVTHVVTARLDPSDREMADRVERHRAERGAETTIEVWQAGLPELPEIVAGAPAGTTLLIDSLGTWVAGTLLDFETLAQTDAPRALAQLEARSEPLVRSLTLARCEVVIVAEETGWGIVPISAQGRVFRDHLGRLTRRIGQQCERVELVVAGFAVDLRAQGVSVGEPDGR